MSKKKTDKKTPRLNFYRVSGKKVSLLIDVFGRKDNKTSETL